MTNLIEKSGNLFDSHADAIGHGVNTYGVMGAGIAYWFRDKHPVMYTAYRSLCKNGWLKPGGVYGYICDQEGDPGLYRAIFNIASQQAPGADATLEWLDAGVRLTVQTMDVLALDVLALPRIGCGIGGLHWEDVKDVLTVIAESSMIDIEVWSL